MELGPPLSLERQSTDYRLCGIFSGNHEWQRSLSFASFFPPSSSISVTLVPPSMPTENPVLQNVFGTIGAVLWSIQIIPQIWKSYRDKSTEGLSGTLML
jgi:hypothetical protein